MNYLIKILIFVILTFTSVANASNNGFVGVIGAAIGDIKNQKNESLSNGSKIFFGDTIISKSKSNAQILFLDQTVLTLGEETELTIDEFVYDPNSQDGSFVSTVKTGTVKFITGQISKKNPDNLEVKVPAGTLGARGTEFVVLSESNNESTVVLLGPGPNNSLGMIPGNLILSDGVNSVSITNPGFEAMVKN
ncbi:FecR domain-containing protein [Candidatus Pelagibacter sp.]|nr:FecR domain-containing protein [Candidatus Pelagibacter sp.]